MPSAAWFAGAFNFCVVQEAVKFQIKHWGDRLQEGDVLVSNHPQLAGGR